MRTGASRPSSTSGRACTCASAGWDVPLIRSEPADPEPRRHGRSVGRPGRRSNSTSPSTSSHLPTSSPAGFRRPSGPPGPLACPHPALGRVDRHGVAAVEHFDVVALDVGTGDPDPAVGRIDCFRIPDAEGTTGSIVVAAVPGDATACTPATAIPAFPTPPVSQSVIGAPFASKGYVPNRGPSTTTLDFVRPLGINLCISAKRY